MTIEERTPCGNKIAMTFGLTAAEMRVAGLIAEGKNAHQAARHLGRSYETVRNQLKSIFDKTDTRRQSALAILVVRMEQRSQ
jgi:DNA-binding CsgD family transcriptional regulator